MPNANPSHVDLQAVALEIMRQRGFDPDFPPTVQQQLAELKAHPPQIAAGNAIRDLRNLLWSSIDNDTSRDLDQIEAAERQPNGEVKVLIGIADVDAFVPKQSAIDQHDPDSVLRYRRTLEVMKEVKSRHGRLVAVATEGDRDITSIADDVFFVPAAPELLLPIVEVIPLQLFAYHVATKKGYDVDHPRNLVKAVVTE